MQDFQHLRINRIVVCNHYDELALGPGQAAVEAGVHPQVLPVAIVSEARVLETLDDWLTAGRRVVVGDNSLKIRDRLPLQRAQGLEQEVGPPPRAQAKADPGLGSVALLSAQFQLSFRLRKAFGQW